MRGTSRGTGRFAAALAVAALGCGGDPLDRDGSGLTASLQPRSVGTTWTYVTSKPDGSRQERKTTKVIAHEDVGGVDAAVLETRRGAKVSQVWLGEVDGRILRLREETRETGKPAELRRFEPGSLRVPASLDGLRVGQALPSSYTEVILDEQGAELGRIERSPAWTVEALGEEVDTPAGRFGTIRLKRSGDEADGSVEKRIWYAPGVGKVKELGNRLELLESYQIAE